MGLQTISVTEKLVTIKYFQVEDGSPTGHTYKWLWYLSNQLYPEQCLILMGHVAFQHFIQSSGSQDSWCCDPLIQLLRLWWPPTIIGFCCYFIAVMIRIEIPVFFKGIRRALWKDYHPQSCHDPQVENHQPFFRLCSWVNVDLPTQSPNLVIE